MAKPFLKSLSTDLASLLFNETDTDFVLLANNEERLPVHSFLLKARSPFFNDLLSSKMETGREARLDVDKKVLSLIITFLYTAQYAFCKVYFSAQPNKLRPILKFEKYFPVEHIFVPACSSARKIHFFKF